MPSGKMQYFLMLCLEEIAKEYMIYLLYWVDGKVLIFGTGLNCIMTTKYSTEAWNKLIVENCAYTLSWLNIIFSKKYFSLIKKKIMNFCRLMQVAISFSMLNSDTFFWREGDIIEFWYGNHTLWPLKIQNLKSSKRREHLIAPC